MWLEKCIPERKCSLREPCPGVAVGMSGRARHCWVPPWAGVRVEAEALCALSLLPEQRGRSFLPPGRGLWEAGTFWGAARRAHEVVSAAQQHIILHFHLYSCLICESWFVKVSIGVILLMRLYSSPRATPLSTPL